MEGTLRQNQAQNLAWLSSSAAHLVKQDQRIELLTDMVARSARRLAQNERSLDELRAARAK